MIIKMLRRFIIYIYKMDVVNIKSKKAPDFIIVGVQKGGTTSLFNDLKKHPNIKLKNNKEAHFFDRHYAKGISWYRVGFHLKTDKRITGEATPSYIYPNVIKRIQAHLPK